MNRILSGLAYGWNRLAGLFSPARGPSGGEKIRTAGGFGQITFLPYYDNVTDETAEIRAEYRKMLREPTVKAALRSKVLAVAALDLQVHPADKRDPRKREVADFCKDNLLGLAPGGLPHFAESFLLGGLVEGLAVAEKVWKPDPEPRGKWAGKRMLRAIKPKDTRFTQLAVDQFRNVLAVRGTAYNAGQLYDPRDFVIWTHMPLWENPAGMSDLRAAYRAYWVKDTAWKLRAIYLEKYAAGGMMKGTYKRNEARPALEAALAAAKASTWVALPDGSTLDVIDLATRGTADFQSAIEDLDKEVMLGIAGAFLQALEGGTPGGRGDSAVHKDTADLLKWSLSASLAHALKTQVVPDLVDLNFAGEDYSDVTLGAIDDGDLKPSLEIDEGLQRLGLPLSRKALYAKYGRDEPEDEADVLPPPAQPQTAGSPIAPGGLFAANGHAAGTGGPAEPFRGSERTGAHTSWGHYLRDEA